MALLISTQQTDKVKATIAFSPGEYLKGIDLSDKLKSIDIPIYVTSAKKEIENITGLLKFVNPQFVNHFRPEVDGFHGSKTLWESVKGYESYWQSLKLFFQKMEK